MSKSNWDKVQEQLDELAKEYEREAEFQVKDWLKIVVSTRVWQGDKRLDIRQYIIPKDEPEKGWVPTGKGVVVPEAKIPEFLTALFQVLKEAGYDYSP